MSDNKRTMKKSLIIVVHRSCIFGLQEDLRRERERESKKSGLTTYLELVR